MQTIAMKQMHKIQQQEPNMYDSISSSKYNENLGYKVS
jgi:hypothetical protein